MKDASAKRRIFGKLGVIAAAAIILPLTATIVPAVVAQESEKPAEEAQKPETVKRNVKVIRLNRDGKDVHVIAHDGDGKEVTKIERDGKTFVFRTDKKLSEEEVEKMVAQAEKSREELEDALGEADAVRTKADAAQGQADSAQVAAAHARAAAELGRIEAIRVMSNMDFASYIPEIDIKEITKNCREGQPVTTDVSGFDGQNKSRVRVVMCGMGQAKIARLEALKGLKEARGDIREEKDIPEKVRKDVMKKLEQEIRKLEAQTDRLD